LWCDIIAVECVAYHYLQLKFDNTFPDEESGCQLGLMETAIAHGLPMHSFCGIIVLS